MRIAFTHNLKVQNHEDEAEFDTKETVDAIRQSLMRLGHQVDTLEVSGPASRIVSRLESLNPDLVFNTAEGSHGRFREAFYPSLFEQLGLPYTGSDPYVCLLTLDKTLTKMVLEKHGVQTPRWLFIDSMNGLKKFDLSFPVIVKPNFEGSSKGIRVNSIVENAEQLRERISELLLAYPNGLLVEEFVIGKDIVVPFLERANPKDAGVLPPCEYVFDPAVVGGRKFQIYDYDLKNELSHAVDVKIAELPDRQLRELKSICAKIYRVLGIRDLGRIDFRIDAEGRFYFLEVNALPSLEPGAGIYVAAAHVGLSSVDAVLEKVIESAQARFKIKKSSKKKPSQLTVGVTYNLKRILPDPHGVNDSEAEFDAESTVDAVAKAIESFGHRVVKLEATAELPNVLATSGVDVVFNMAEGIRGRSRESQVPALLDLVGIEYTGSDAATMSITLDKLMAKKLVHHAGLSTPNYFQMVTGNEKLPRELKFPLIIKPVAEGSSKGVSQSSIVKAEGELREKTKLFLEKYRQPVLVEEYIKGREFTVGLLSGKKPKVLPPMEIVFLNKNLSHPVYSFEYKQDFCSEVRFDAPAQISKQLQGQIERTARRCFDALGCRDLARIDFRLGDDGQLYFIECNPLPGLVPDWSDLCLIAKGAGIDYKTLIQEILSPAIKRHKAKYHHMEVRNERKNESAGLGDSDWSIRAGAL